MVLLLVEQLMELLAEIGTIQVAHIQTKKTIHGGMSIWEAADGLITSLPLTDMIVAVKDCQITRSILEIVQISDQTQHVKESTQVPRLLIAI